MAGRKGGCLDGACRAGFRVWCPAHSEAPEARAAGQAVPSPSGTGAAAAAAPSPAPTLSAKRKASGLGDASGTSRKRRLLPDDQDESATQFRAQVKGFLDKQKRSISQVRRRPCQEQSVLR